VMSRRPRLVEEGTPIYRLQENVTNEAEGASAHTKRHDTGPCTFLPPSEKPPNEHKNISTHIVIGERPRRNEQFEGSSRTHDNRKLDDIMTAKGTSLAKAAFASGFVSTNAGSHQQPRKSYPQTHFVVGGNRLEERNRADIDTDMDTSDDVGHHYVHQRTETNYSHEHTHQQHNAVPITIGASHGFPGDSYAHQHNDHNHVKHRSTAHITIGGEQQHHSLQFGSQKQQDSHQIADVHSHHRHHFSHDHTRQHESVPITIGHQHSPFFHHHIEYSQGGSHEPIINNSTRSDQAEARMELDDIIPKEPLIVIDGANVAYAYADVNTGLCTASTTLTVAGRNNGKGKLEPDARGINVAAQYFLNAGCRVQVVIPTGWLRAKPRIGDTNRNDALMETPQVETLRELKERNLLCTAPPGDDDDAYALAIARREDSRARRRGGGGGGGFVLSNDFFRDAISRDVANGEGIGLRKWLESQRISYSFLNMNSANAFGDHELDFMPNPRHLLVMRTEKEHRSNEIPPG